VAVKEGSQGEKEGEERSEVVTERVHVCSLGVFSCALTRVLKWGLVKHRRTSLPVRVVLQRRVQESTLLRARVGLKRRKVCWEKY